MIDRPDDGPLENGLPRFHYRLSYRIRSSSDTTDRPIIEYRVRSVASAVEIVRQQFRTPKVYCKITSVEASGEQCDEPEWYRVQQFTNDGKFLRGVGGEGTEPGRFHLPHGIVLDSRDCLYVTDTMNARIQKFAVN